MTPYQQGYEAGKDPAKRWEDCPYKSGSSDCMNWHLGYAKGWKELTAQVGDDLEKGKD